ncbi:MAG TPA: TonB-dependent receptor [Bacteroidia bacterium]|jgi:iron complex outermembrane receptor protein|nr:TonB-dependent receptor [Bacteroidia bacterium]
MKHTAFYLLLFVFLCSGPMKAQSTGTLRGTVIDEQTKEMLTGATIVDKTNPTSGSVADVNGKYELHLPAGRHTLICSFIGMISDTFSVLIDTTSPVIHNVSLRSGSMQLQTLVVSAGRYERKLQDITVSMEVLKPALIENKNSTNIKDALEQAPGLDILDGEPQIRGGSGFNFGVGSRVAILIDGLPALPGDGGHIDWNFIPVENVSQIEIIKGASSVTYGSSALSGSINVRTAYPTDVPVTTASTYYGQYDAPSVPGTKWWNGAAGFYGASFLHAQKFGQFDLVIGGMGLYDHGFIGPPAANPLIASTAVDPNTLGEKTGRFNFNLRYRPKKYTGLNYGINGNFMQSSNNTSLIWNNDTTGLYRAYPNTITLQKQTLFYIDPFINYFSANGYRHSLRARYFYTDNRVTNSPSNKTDIAYCEYQCTKEFESLGGLNITGGLVMNQTYSHADSLTVLGGFYPSASNHLQNFAAYMQLDKKFWKVLNVSLGFRDENFKMNDSHFSSQPIFRSGLNLQVARATFLRYSYGQGYRFPSITEKYLNSEIGGLAVFSNNNLQPESSWNTEIGIKQGFRIKNFSGFVDVAAFWQQYQNTIEITYGYWGTYDNFGTTAYNAGFKYLNTGETRVRGVELSIPAEGKLMKDLTLSVLAGYTYILPQTLNPGYIYATDTLQQKQSYNSTSTDTKNNILKYRFQHVAKIDVQLTYKRFSLGGDWRYYSYIQNIDTIFYTEDKIANYGIERYREIHHSGTSVVDLRAGVALSKKLKLAFIVNNVMNLSYSLRPLKIESPRTFAIRLSLKV